MTEQEPVLPADVRQVIALAIGAAGSSENVPAWRGRINANIPMIAAMLGPDSGQWKQAVNVLSAQKFVGEYRGYDYEETSTRCKVNIFTRESKRYPDGLEPIRTERTDSTLGRRQRAMLDELTIGHKLLIWRHNEQINDETVVRMLAHFEKLSGGTPAPRRETAAAPTAPPTQSGPAPDIDNPVLAAINGLAPRSKVLAAQAVRRAVGNDWTSLTDEQVKQALAIVDDEASF